MKRILTIVLLIIHCSLFTIHCLGQDQKIIDSLENDLKKFEAHKRELGGNFTALMDSAKANTLDELSYNYWGNNPEKAMDYAQQCLSVSEQIGFKKGIVNSYISMGVINKNKGNYPQALEFYHQAIKVAEEIKDKRGVAIAYTNIGNIYMRQGNYPESLKSFLEALKIYEEIGGKRNKGNLYNNIGNVYFNQGNFPEALKNHFASLKIREEIGDKYGLSLSYLNIGEVNEKLGNYDDAIKNYLAAKKIKEEIGDRIGIAMTYGNFGTIYLLQGNYPEALVNQLKALQVFEEIDDKNGIGGTTINIGIVFEKQGKHSEALKYVTKGLSLALEMGAKDLIKDAYEELAVIDSAIGNYKGSLEHYKLFITFRDSMVNTENTKKTAALQMNYEMDKKEKEIDLLKSQQEIDRLNKSQTLGIIFGMGGALLGMISVAFVFYQQRNKISKEKKISEYERGRSDELLLNILPAEVANELKQKGTSEARDYESATVLFTDFKDFTKISEKMTPSELVKEIDFCFSAFDNIIHKHGIEKIKTIGDAYMCAGGLPVANKTHAEDTVKAAIEIRDFMANHNKEKLAKGELPFEIRIGINTGPVVAGIVGVKKFAYDIWGDTVNLASRMESSGKEGEVNISGSTYELIKDKFTCSHRGKIQTKNKGEVDMYFVDKL